MNRFLLTAALAVSLQVTALTHASAEPALIAVFTKNFTNPAYAAARRGADLVAAESGAITRHYVPEKPDDVAQQKALVEKALTTKPDLVLFVPVDDTAMVADVKKFTDAGIPVVTFINKLAGSFVTHVGSDDVAVGYSGASALIKAMGGKGKLLAIEGNPAAPTSRDRVAGMRKAVKEHPGVGLLDVVTGMYQEKDAYNVAVGALPAYPQIDGIWAANDVMVYGALKALDESGRTSKLVGANGLDKAIQLIEQGQMIATVEFSSFKIACTAARAALRHLQGIGLPPEIVIPSALIDRTNVADFAIPLEKRDCPSWEAVAGQIK